MTELFDDIPEYIRFKTRVMLDMMMANAENDPKTAAMKVAIYCKGLKTEHEKDYVDFCFKSRMEQERESSIN